VSSGTSAGFGRRLAALVYDAILLAALLVVFTSGAVYLNHRTAVEPESAGRVDVPLPRGPARRDRGLLLAELDSQRPDLGECAPGIFAPSPTKACPCHGMRRHGVWSSPCSPGHRQRSACCGSMSIPSIWRFMIDGRKHGLSTCRASGSLISRRGCTVRSPQSATSPPEPGSNGRAGLRSRWCG